jgi:hypothetical protein
VLAVPTDEHAVSFETSHGRIRWLVPLDGSVYAEAILDPLSSLSGWIPSDITLVQPAEFARLWTSRITSSRLSGAPRMGPSISDSWDYLSRVAHSRFGDSPARVSSATDADSVSSIIRLANASAIDAVAIGLSNRWRITRYLAAEFNEPLLGRVNKPILLFKRASL